MASAGSTVPAKRKNRDSGSSSAKIDVEVYRQGLKQEGVIFVCGEGDTGQLGLGEDVQEALRPRLLPDVTGSHVAAGAMHSVVVSSDRKKVITFGCSDDGTLGRPTSSNDALPENVPGVVDLGTENETISMVSAGDSHTAVLTESGYVYLWGVFRDSQGTFGLVKPFQTEVSPVKIKDIGKAIKISSGANHVVILEDNGSVVTLGCGEQGQLGRITQRSCTRNRRNGVNILLNPTEVTMRGQGRANKVVNVWAGGYGTYANRIDDSGILVCGLNNYGQLGIQISQSALENHCLYRLTPAPSLGKKWKKIVSSIHHAVLLSDKGEVYTLGRKEYGRLGLGEDCSDALTPTRVPALQDVVCSDIACGPSFSFALAENGTVYSWGMQGPQLGLGSSEDDHYVPVAIPSNYFKGKIPYEIAAGSQHLIVLAREADESEPKSKKPRKN